MHPSDLLEAYQATQSPAPGRYLDPDSATFKALRRFAEAETSGQQILPPIPDGYSAMRNDDVTLLYALQAEVGGGMYAFHHRPESGVALEVPHRYFDVGTGDLGVRLFAQMRASSLLLNTAHRYRGSNCTTPSSCPSDVAHNANSAFHAVHSGVAAHVPVLALHGFKAEARDPDAVVSAAGTPTDIECVVRSLERTAPSFRIARYPFEHHALGGVRCAQAQFCRANGRPMIHVEMSRSLRTFLTSDAHALAALASDLQRCFPAADL